MLAAVAMLIAGRPLVRLAYFLFCFAVWDIFYYLFLKLLLAWPPSLLTWDVLFLIPVVWVGPVLAPVLVAAAMGGGRRGHCPARRPRRARVLRRLDWALIVSGALVIVVSFLPGFQAGHGRRGSVKVPLGGLFARVGRRDGGLRPSRGACRQRGGPVKFRKPRIKPDFWKQLPPARRNSKPRSGKASGFRFR